MNERRPVPWAPIIEGLTRWGWRVPAVVYALLVIAGLLRLTVWAPAVPTTQPAPDVWHRAARALATNHRLGAGDLTADAAATGRVEALYGRYLPAAVEAGAPLRPDSLLPAPRLLVPDTVRLLRVPLHSGWVALGVNAGAVITLCDTAGCSLGDLPVAAVWCGDTTGSSCSALVLLGARQPRDVWRRLVNESGVRVLVARFPPYREDARGNR